MYVSVFGDERGKEVAMAGLKSKAKYVRGELGRRMKLRLTPEIRFLEDESFERGSRVRITIFCNCAIQTMLLRGEGGVFGSFSAFFFFFVFLMMKLWVSHYFGLILLLICDFVFVHIY